MHLIDVYIQEVTRRLPEKSREDIGLELRSTIEDMLPENYSENNVYEVLEQLGNPAALASGYLDKPMHLIGPRYFDVYTSLLKMIIPIATVIALISMVAEHFIHMNEGEAILSVILLMIGEGIWRIIGVVIQVFFWLTLVFAIIERTDKGREQYPLSARLKKWTPNDLNHIPYVPVQKVISKRHVFASLMGTAIWATIYYYANHLVGIYEGGENGLVFVLPAFNQDVLLRYWPIVVVVIALEIWLALYKLLVGQWTKKVAIFNTVSGLFATMVFIVILTNPHLLNQEFIAYMSELFTTTAGQFETVLVSGAIIIIIVSVAMSIFDGFRKVRLFFPAKSQNELS